MRKGYVILMCFSLMGFISGCGGSSSSDESVNNPPQTQIAKPMDGNTFSVGEEIVFGGGSVDSEDGYLSGASLEWHSNIDGQIGYGETCISDALSAGNHLISLTATDSEGATGLDSVAIFVDSGTITSSLPDTGQTDSYTNVFGEDSDYTINPHDYTKLDVAGNDLDDSAADWAMVRDKVTGLIWEVKTDDDGIHDRDNRYHTIQDAHDDFIIQLKSHNFGGHNDWRLPTIIELSTLVHRGRGPHATCINTAYFPNTSWPAYWSSTIDANNADDRWSVHFGSGNIYSAKGEYVRAVRGPQSVHNLLPNGDGTVTDTATGLMWQQAEAGNMTWEEALSYCETLELANYDDWRLPNINELQSIVNYAAYGPAIDTTLFPEAAMHTYWSSTSHNVNTTVAFKVNFTSGEVTGLDKSLILYVRAVRSQ